jgi:hypothetical protein
MIFCDARKGQFEWPNTIAPLLGDRVVLLAMKHGRAPLSVSPALSKGLRRLGVLNDLYDLGSIARRLSFLGDGQILLAELKMRATIRPAMEEAVSKGNRDCSAESSGDRG